MKKTRINFKKVFKFLLLVFLSFSLISCSSNSLFPSNVSSIISSPETLSGKEIVKSYIDKINKKDLSGAISMVRDKQGFDSKNYRESLQKTKYKKLPFHKEVSQTILWYFLVSHLTQCILILVKMYLNMI